MAQHVADELLADHFIWVDGEGWLIWNGLVWEHCSRKVVEEEIRKYFVTQHLIASEELVTGDGNREEVEGWFRFLTESKIGHVRSVAEAIVMVQADQLDTDKDLVNTPSGIVDLANGGAICPHDPTLYMTRITSGDYRPGYTHHDWEKAKTVLPAPELEWMQTMLGHGITGYHTKGGLLPILQGSGENGKGVMTTDGVVPALGDYADVASTKLFQADKEHSEEVATLRGKRIMIAEELTEGRALNVATIKRIMDNTRITARYLYGHLMSFDASHTLFATTNHIPVVSDTDHGIWRRLVMVRFPYTFRKPGEPLVGEWDRRGDGELKLRIKDNESGQHDAIVTWVIEGALRYYADPVNSLALTPGLVESTKNPPAATRSEAHQRRQHPQHRHPMHIAFHDKCR
jgi:P4 family phage/plasmid primase-like protien